MGAQHRHDLLLGEHRGEPVAAQQVDVARAGAEGAGVDLDRQLGAERACDHRALGVLDGLLGGEAALAHELVDERVVVGEAQQLAVTQAVGPAVAHVCDRDVLLADVHGGERGAHSGLLGVGVGELVDARVGRLRERGQRELGVGCGPPARA